MNGTSLQRKVLGLIIAAVGFVQIVAIGLSLYGQAQSYAASQRELLLSEQRTLASAVSGAVALHDTGKVYATLRAVGRMPDLNFIAVNHLDGSRMAALGAAEMLGSDFELDEATPLTVTQLLTAHSFALRTKIVDGGRTVGSLLVVGDAGGIKRNLWSTLVNSGAALLASILAASLIAFRMMLSVTQPLTQLTKAMSRVADGRDYSRLAPTGPVKVKEVGALIDGFNQMLLEIQERDQRIARSYAELEQQVQSRTIDLRIARDAAEAAQQSAERANAQKSDFLATMSHEIRTPMNGLLVMAELLARSELPTKSQRYADVIWRSGKSLLAIINDILDFSKIEAGKLELEQAPIDVVELATTVLDLFGEKARSKGLDLAAQIATDAPVQLLGDSVRLTQILSNLVNNALKFTERGGVRLAIGPDPRDPTRLRFSVEDTGIGVAADKTAAIFGAFSQADMSTTRKYGGTGLGLAICRRLVQAMGAEMEVTSELGVGSQFSFSLACVGLPSQPAWPLLPQSAGLPCRVGIHVEGAFTCGALAYYLRQCAASVTQFEAVPAPQSLSDLDILFVGSNAFSSELADQARSFGAKCVVVQDFRAETPGSFGGASLSWPLSRAELQTLIGAIAENRFAPSVARSTATSIAADYVGFTALVADDNEVNREVAQEALSLLGFKTTVVCDGREAVEAAGKTQFDIIFLDGSMPVLDGYAACREIRAVEALRAQRRIPIVALTAHVIGADANVWRDAGADAKLGKPFTLDALKRCVSTLLEGANPRTAAEIEPEAATSLPASALDMRTVDELKRFAAAGRVDFVNRVVRLYLEHAPSAVTDIERLAGSSDLESLAKAAHALKSMSLNIGAHRVAACSGGIEQAAKSGQPLDRSPLEELKTQVAIACDELASLLTSDVAAA